MNTYGIFTSLSLYLKMKIQQKSFRSKNIISSRNFYFLLQPHFEPKCNIFLYLQYLQNWVYLVVIWHVQNIVYIQSPGAHTQHTSNAYKYTPSKVLFARRNSALRTKVFKIILNDFQMQGEMSVYSYKDLFQVLVVVRSSLKVIELISGPL